MRSRTFSSGIVIIALSTAATISPALAQKAKSSLYALHSAANGSCPGLDWHLTVTGDKLEGFVGVAHTNRLWRLEGTIKPASVNQERSFEMEAEEVGGAKRKAVIRGTSGGEFLNAMITGAGTACDGKTIVIPRAVQGVEAESG